MYNSLPDQRLDQSLDMIAALFNQLLCSHWNVKYQNVCTVIIVVTYILWLEINSNRKKSTQREPKHVIKVLALKLYQVV